ncbi:MAG: glutamyl-tRNA amidotransferase, partial [Chloroflexi bacterium]|nr:glutamyl-tRNA amidotransferase [Chloroflexota bacterium]
MPWVPRKALPGRSATELVGLIRAGEISSREAVDAHIQRIEEVDVRLHAVVVRRFDEARAEADAADLARARGDSLGPLHGAPITIKEQFLVEGTATTFGLPSRASHRAERDGPLV